MEYPERYPREKESDGLKAACDKTFQIIKESRAGARLAYEMAMQTEDPVKRATHLKEMGMLLETCIADIQVIADKLSQLEEICASPTL